MKRRHFLLRFAQPGRRIKGLSNGLALDFTRQPKIRAVASSSWQLWLAGRLQQQLKTTPFVEVSVDQAPPVRVQTSEALRIEIPAGARDHVWKLSAAR